MARLLIPITSVAETGTAQPAQVTGVAADDLYLPATVDEATIIEIENTDGSDHDVEFVANFSVASMTLANLTVTVTAGTVKLVALDNLSVLRQADDTVNVNVATDTYMKFRAYRG